MDTLVANAGLIWLAAAILLGAAELVVSGVFLVFLAIAAAMTGLSVLALPILPPAAQLLSFAIWSTLSIMIGRRWYADFPVATADPLLNDRGARLIGDLVTVIEPMTGGEGRVQVADGVWSAIGADAAVGQQLRITGIRDGKLLVEPTTPAP